MHHGRGTAGSPGSRAPQFPWLSRAAGIAFGLGTQLLFGFTVWHLFVFLRDGGTHASKSFLLTDSLLAAQFAVIHSLLLYPTMKKRLQRWIPPAFYGSFFCVATCLCLLTVIRFWQTDANIDVTADGWPAVALQSGYFASWAALFYSLWLSGLGYQTGWTPWWHWFRRTASPRREFEERGAYRWFRHPIYLSFLGLIWFTPHVTGDRLVLMAVWTIYIAVGSHLKDERLALFLGGVYRNYQSRVPGYPLIGFGPLGRRKPEDARPDTPDVQPVPQRRAA